MSLRESVFPYAVCYFINYIRLPHAGRILYSESTGGVQNKQRAREIAAGGQRVHVYRAIYRLCRPGPLARCCGTSKHDQTRSCHSTHNNLYTCGTETNQCRELVGGCTVRDVVTLNNLKSIIFCDITPCSPLKVNLCFGRTCRLHLHG
jgi:hypothetical protein